MARKIMPRKCKNPCKFRPVCGCPHPWETPKRSVSFFYNSLQYEQTAGTSLPEHYTYNDEELLPAIAAGEQKAFEELFNDYYPRILYFAQRFNIALEEAEDIVTEAFTKFWLSRTNFDNLNKIKSYLYTTTRNAALNSLRRNKRYATRELSDTAEEQTADIEIIRADLIGTIFKEIERLPDKAREVILLTYRDGLNAQEIAERLNISVSNVTSQRSRAISLLRIALAEKYPACLPLIFPSLLGYLLHHS
jgi:RNA polymerase sigma-70 factor (family 1)